MDFNFTPTKTSPKEFISNKVKILLYDSHIQCSGKSRKSPSSTSFDNVLNSSFLSVIHYFDYFNIIKRTSTFIA